MRFDRIHQSRIDAAEAAYGLTDDEREVLSLSRRGKSVVAIGMELGMSTRTVSRRRRTQSRLRPSTRARCSKSDLSDQNKMKGT